MTTKKDSDSIVSNTNSTFLKELYDLEDSASVFVSKDPKKANKTTKPKENTEKQE